MKKVILFSFALLCMLVMPVNAKKPKLSYKQWFLMERQENKEKQPNDSISLSYRITHTNRYPERPQSEMFNPQIYFIITVRNNTERPVYVDLQKSFLVVNGETLPLFTNSVNVTTQGSTSITGVNLGLVGVGSANTEINSKQTYEQRIINVQGESKKSIEIPLVTKWGVPWRLENVNGEIAVKKRSDGDLVGLYHDFIHMDEVLNYDASNTPLTFDIRMCYSFDEDMTNTFVGKSEIVTTHIVGVSFNNTNVTYSNVLKISKKIFPDIEAYTNSDKKISFFIWSMQDEWSGKVLAPSRR